MMVVYLEWHPNFWTRLLYSYASPAPIPSHDWRHPKPNTSYWMVPGTVDPNED